MKYIFWLFFLMSFLSCQEKNRVVAGLQKDRLSEELYMNLSAHPSYMDEKKEELWRYVLCYYPDSICGNDSVLERKDPNAYWLMKVMLQMEKGVENCDDCWAWMLNVDDCIQEYNRRLGREIGNSDIAMATITELIGDYGMGTQFQMNVSSDVFFVIAFYKMVKAYSEYISFVDNFDVDPCDHMNLSDLCYQEFCAWFDMMKQSNNIMIEYTFACAAYSSLPMDMAYIYMDRITCRHALLDKESDLLWRVNERPYIGNGKVIRPRTFKALLNHFMELYQIPDAGDDSTQNDTTVEEDNVMEEPIDYRLIALYAADYELALEAWRELRERIVQRLPLGMRSSYRAITNELHSNFYQNLLELSEPVF